MFVPRNAALASQHLAPCTVFGTKEEKLELIQDRKTEMTNTLKRDDLLGGWKPNLIFKMYILAKT